MEGERILESLKTGGSLDGVLLDIKSYLGPVLACQASKQTTSTQPVKTKVANSKFGKYELFSLKVLKLCIERCQSTSGLDPINFLKVGTVTVESLEVCMDASGKAPPLSFEKLLYHFATQCFNCEEYASGMRACKVLYDKIRLGGGSGNDPQLKTEGSSLLKFSFNLLWKAAAKLEQPQVGQGQDKQEGTLLSSAEVVLHLRELAFLCLLSSGCEFSFLLDRVLKADLRFQKLTGCSDSAGLVCEPLKQLHFFHASLLEHPAMSLLCDPRSPCKVFISAMEYLLHVARVSTNAGLSSEGTERVQTVVCLCEQHGRVCWEKAHVSCVVLAQITELLVAVLARASTPTAHSESVLSASGLHLLEKVAAGASKLREVILPSSLPRFIDALDLLLSVLEDRQKESHSCFIPQEAFVSLEAIVNFHVECIEMHLRVQLSTENAGETATCAERMRSAELTACSQQLASLSFLAQVLLDLFLALDDSEMDDIEVMRSSVTRYRMPVSPPPPHPKKDLAESCLPILQRSRDIILKARKDVPAIEHKCLGNSAFNLGLALYRSKMYAEAVPVLKLACRELGEWCTDAGSEKEKLDRSEASQLLKKLTLLFECSQEASLDSESTRVVELAFSVLPLSQVKQPTCVSALTGLWVKARRKTPGCLHTGADLGRWCTVADALRKRLPPVPPEVMAEYLEEELKLYKTRSKGTATRDQFTVAKQLLDLYSGSLSDTKTIDRARLMVEVATIGRKHEAEADYPGPLSLLEEAVLLLEPLTASARAPASYLSRVHEQLAITHLWKAICTQEDLINSCLTHKKTLPDRNTDSGPRKLDVDRDGGSLCLSEYEAEKILCEDGEQCLHSAVQCWEDMWTTVQRSKMRKLSDGVYDVSTTFQNLYLTYSLCHAHRKSLLALTSLGVLIEFYQFEPLPHLKSFYQNALALHAELAMPFMDGDREAHQMVSKLLTAAAEGSCDAPTINSKATQELQASQLYCQLSLAQLRLSSGEYDACRELLVQVFQHPLLQKNTTLAYSVAARGKLVISSLLQHRQFTVKSTEDFLQYMLRSEETIPLDDTSFRLTDLECTSDSLKIYRNLAALHSVSSQSKAEASTATADERKGQEIKEGEDQGGSSSELLDEEFFVGIDDPDTLPKDGRVLSMGEDSTNRSPVDLSISPSLTAWDVLNKLLSTFKSVSKIYLIQGATREAYFFAREGLALSKLLLLHRWHVDFLILLSEIQHTRGQEISAKTLLLQTGRLLDLGDYLPHTSPTKSPTRKCNASCSPELEVASDHEFPDDSLFEDFLALSINNSDTKTDKRRSTTLIVHPSACMCSNCASFDHIIQTSTVLLLYSRLTSASAATSLQQQALDILSEASRLMSQGVERCDKWLCSYQQPIYTEEVQKSKGRKRACSKPRQLTLRTTNSSMCKAIAARILLEKAKCFLKLDDVTQSLILCKEALTSLLTSDLDTRASGSEVSQVLVETYYWMGVSLVRQMEKEQAELAAELWENQFHSTDPDIHPKNTKAAEQQIVVEQLQPLKSRQAGRKTVMGAKKKQSHAAGIENDVSNQPSKSTRKPAQKRSTKGKEKETAVRGSQSKATRTHPPTESVTSSDVSRGDGQEEEELVVRSRRGRRRAIILDSSDSESECPLIPEQDSRPTRRNVRQPRSALSQHNAKLVTKPITSKEDVPSSKCRVTTVPTAPPTRRSGRTSGTTVGKGGTQKGSTRKSVPEAGDTNAGEMTYVAERSRCDHFPGMSNDNELPVCTSISELLASMAPPILQSLSHFLSAFQYCYPTAPAHLLRDTCHWLCVILSPSLPQLSTHFLLLGTQPTLSHQAVYSMGKKIKGNMPCTTDVALSRDSLTTLSQQSGYLQPLDPALSAVLNARNILRSPSLQPPTLYHTLSLINQLPDSWTLCSIAMAPSTPGNTSTSDHLLLLQTRPGKEPLLVKVAVNSSSSASRDFEEILAASDESMALKEKRAWWNARGKLNQQLQDLLIQLESSWLGHWKCLLSGSVEEEWRSRNLDIASKELREQLEGFGVTVGERCSEVLMESGDGRIEIGELHSMLREVSNGKLTDAQCEQIGGFITTRHNQRCSQVISHTQPSLVLLLGRTFQSLPWESLPCLAVQQLSVTRMPSLPFTYAHKMLVGHSGNFAIDPCRTFYIVNPRNDLPKTEKVFAKWFASEEGWKGVVGRAPSKEEYRSALEDHDLFVYCGHGTGREYLSQDSFHQVHCRATSLLVGCSSGRLAVAGSCDPRGMALNYLIAGCPATVANLWDVTDADIDRFCQALLKSWLHTSTPSRPLPLPFHVAASRSVCKLQRLIGAAPVVYGIPVVVRDTSKVTSTGTS